MNDLSLILDRIHQIDNEIIICEQELIIFKDEILKIKDEIASNYQSKNTVSADEQYIEIIFFIKTIIKDEGPKLLNSKDENGMYIWNYTGSLYDINKQRLIKNGCIVDIADVNDNNVTHIIKFNDDINLSYVDISYSDINSKDAKKISILPRLINDKKLEFEKKILDKKHKILNLKAEKGKKEEEYQKLYKKSKYLNKISIPDQYIEVNYFIKKFAKQGFESFYYENLYDINKQKLEKLGYIVEKMEFKYYNPNDDKDLYSIKW